MESLLSNLCDITPFTSKTSFVNLCWYSLSRVIASKEADNWTSTQRDDFMLFAQYFIRCGEAVFIVKDALIRDNVTNLNSKLVTELAEPLDWLEEFASSIEADDLDKTIDEYAEILLNIEKRMVDEEVAEFAANHFKFFFQRVHSLNIEEQTKCKQLVIHH
ncbi:MAG: hypothetical protein J7623_28480 [Chitinophaga sp.]|uniref:hypothetical protein n=1 Tax=Chitinophaga sp. TaxID=1869181 RepID=UPI001B1DC01B|nr:hypothetical protein [Chitinophaga sp.]MBO9732613.1 hypothetical protein [Chitinophaga sp.]